MLLVMINILPLELSINFIASRVGEESDGGVLYGRDNLVWSMSGDHEETFLCMQLLNDSQQVEERGQ